MRIIWQIEWRYGNDFEMLKEQVVSVLIRELMSGRTEQLDLIKALV